MALEAIGIDRPGLSAVKVLSALSAALILGMIVAAAGRRRWWLGVLLAAAIASMRGFWIEAGTGENVLTGVAFGMLALRAALDPRAGPGRVSFWIVVALLARQDNILLMPAYTFALWQRMPRPRRWRRMFIWGAVTGVLTLGLYALVWWAYASQTPFLARVHTKLFRNCVLTNSCGLIRHFIERTTSSRSWFTVLQKITSYECYNTPTMILQNIQHTTN